MAKPWSELRKKLMEDPTYEARLAEKVKELKEIADCPDCLEDECEIQNHLAVWGRS